MIVYMPTVGQKVRVVRDLNWHFKLYHERRNESLFEYLGYDLGPKSRSFYDDFVGGAEMWKNRSRVEFQAAERKSVEVRLPPGTVLTIDRIYLRKGAGEFDSISFILNDAKLPGKKGIHARVRFWVKLEDVNTGRLQILA